MGRTISGLQGALQPPPSIEFNLAAPAISSSGYAPLLPNDGSFLELPTINTGSYLRKDPENNTVWTVPRSDIDPNASHWSGVIWRDSINGLLYVQTIDDTTTPDTFTLGTIDELTGDTVTLGSYQHASLIRLVWSTGYIYSERDQEDSGNLTINADGGAEIVVSTVDGSLVSGPITDKLNGVPTPTLGYRTKDRTLLARSPYITISTSGMNRIEIFRGGVRVSFPFITIEPPGALENAGSSFPWGDGTVFFASTFQASKSSYKGRMVNRNAYDAWLHALADIAALPK